MNFFESEKEVSEYWAKTFGRAFKIEFYLSREVLGEIHLFENSYNSTIFFSHFKQKLRTLSRIFSSGLSKMQFASPYERFRIFKGNRNLFTPNWKITGQNQSAVWEIFAT